MISTLQTLAHMFPFMLGKQKKAPNNGAVMSETMLHLLFFTMKNNQRYIIMK